MLSLKIEYKINLIEIQKRFNLTKQLYSSVKSDHFGTKPQMVRQSQIIQNTFFQFLFNNGCIFNSLTLFLM